jgi:hypothetical protein
VIPRCGDLSKGDPEMPVLALGLGIGLVGLLVIILIIVLILRVL